MNLREGKKIQLDWVKMQPKGECHIRPKWLQIEAGPPPCSQGWEASEWLAKRFSRGIACRLPGGLFMGSEAPKL